MNSLGFDPKALIKHYAEKVPNWNKPVQKARTPRKPLPLDHPKYGKNRWATLSPGEKGFAFINGKIEEVYVYSRQVANGKKMVEVSPCLRTGGNISCPPEKLFTKKTGKNSEMKQITHTYKAPIPNLVGVRWQCDTCRDVFEIDESDPKPTEGEDNEYLLTLECPQCGDKSFLTVHGVLNLASESKNFSDGRITCP